MKLYIFDIDGTLTRLKPEVLSANPDQATPNRLGEQVALPGVREKIAQLRADRANRFALATNRGGVAWGYLTEGMANDLCEEARQIAGLPENTKIYINYCDPEARNAKGEQIDRVRWTYARNSYWRKPNPGMLVQAMDDAGVEKGDALMVGDLESDRLAATSAGVRFEWAWSFFA